MATRAILEHTVQPDVDVATDINVVRNAPVTIYKEDGVTLWDQSLYAAASGGSPLSNPGITANSLGFLKLYTPIAAPCVVKVGTAPNTISYPSSFYPGPHKIEQGNKSVVVDSTAGTTVTGNLSASSSVAITGPRPWIDPAMYGAAGNTVRLTGAAATLGDTTLNCTASPGVNFTAADVGKTITVYLAGPAGGPLNTQISAVQSSTLITLAGAPLATVPFATVFYGTDDTAAIQTAIAAAITAGGGRIYLRHGFYLVSSTLAIYPGSGTNIVELFGDGCESTQIVQITPNTDVIAIGQNAGFGNCQHPYVHDLTTWAGRYGISLNNTSFSRLERIRTTSATVGIYAMGTNEHIYWENLTVESCSGGGILGGANNSGTTDGDGLPYIAKGIINHVEFNQISGGPVLKLTSGIRRSTGLRLTSSTGGIEVSNIVIEQCTNHGVVIEYAIAMRLCNIANEMSGSTTLEADNTYSTMQIGLGDGDYTISGLVLTPVAGALKHKYTLEVLGGVLYLSDSNLAVNGPAKTFDFKSSGTSQGVLSNVIVTEAANVSTATVHDFCMVNVLTPGGVTITDWAAGTPWIGRSATGLITGNLGIGRDPATYPLEVQGSGLFASAANVTLNLSAAAGTTVALIAFLRAAVTKWQIAMDANATPNMTIVGPSAATSLSMSGSTGVSTFAPGIVIGSGGSQISKNVSATASWTPGVIVNNSRADLTVSCVGAVTGDTVSVGFVQTSGSASLPAGTWITAFVSTGGDALVASIWNQSGGSVTIGAGTVRVAAWH